MVYIPYLSPPVIWCPHASEAGGHPYHGTRPKGDYRPAPAFLPLQASRDSRYRALLPLASAILKS